ncbi:BlaI/MecI/CopY family transcriptional regulator [Streptomyces wedmorensis]|uniref:BlaI/MecI/CopY family transcriptional regulator n=1 Tax=Streptomyces wedmorensis TaxID=43759 RepID=UPI00378C3D14
MTDTSVTVTGLATQYSAQVSTDLELNAKEQERISSEIASLKEQLEGLRNDRSVLQKVQQALGIASEPVAAPAAVPTPRRKSVTSTSARRPARTKKDVTAQGKASSRKTTTQKPSAAAAKQTDKPKVVDLVREVLASQEEPRSSAEISAALAQGHPARTFKTTVVRTTLEELVAKGQAERSKQGSSVFYTAAAQSAAIVGEESLSDQASS